VLAEIPSLNFPQFPPLRLVYNLPSVPVVVIEIRQISDNP
jgi:hypothetical protein